MRQLEGFPYFACRKGFNFSEDCSNFLQKLVFELWQCLQTAVSPDVLTDCFVLLHQVSVTADVVVTTRVKKQQNTQENKK